jgi:hypothetical protein
MKFKMEKQVVTAKTRQLNATYKVEIAQPLKTWNPFENKFDVPDCEQTLYPISTGLKMNFLNKHGFQVGSNGDLAELQDWCKENTTGIWDYKANDPYADEPIPPGANMEDIITNALAREIQLEIDKEILASLGVISTDDTSAYVFFFEKENDALLFKLTWSGYV